MALSIDERKQRLQELKDKGYTYCDISGIVKNKWGRIVSSKNHSGYIVISKRNGNTCLLIRAHHFAWFYHYGIVPLDQIDHINGVRDDNRIDNLREVNNQQNHFNETNAKGYHWDSARNKFKSEITLNGKNKYLGRFKTELEARNAYLEAKLKYHII
jgi:hypothetical protein